jgi:hypothetical protein
LAADLAEATAQTSAKTLGPANMDEGDFARRSTLAARLERVIETDLKPIVEALRSADPVIRCGLSDPDPRAEARIADARAALGAAADDVGCGRLVVLWEAYRCVECGRWFHRGCIVRHFERHRG